MIARVESGFYSGITPFKVNIECDLTKGLPSFTIVGLPDTAIQESKERVRASILNSEFEFPMKKITVNLAPANVKKEGPSFDLPIALSILISSNQLPATAYKDYLFVGELSLSGKLRPVKGILLLAELTKKLNKKGLIVPLKNANEAASIKDIDVIGSSSLREVYEFLSGRKAIDPYPYQPIKFKKYAFDFNELKGQLMAKRAAEIAAAGGHSLLMVGSPGSGKTMIAERLPTILPPLTLNEAIQVTKIYSVAGLINGSLVEKRPFRKPHHTVSPVGLAGGGTNPRPGEISLSHHGVLFLDELPEFTRSCLEVLRQPIEEEKVHITRASGNITYPANFSLIAAMNPCPCGWLGDTKKECICTPNQVRAYRKKLSGPLLDRIDLQVSVPRLSTDELCNFKTGEPSSDIRTRVIKARESQLKRFSNSKLFCNAQMQSRHLRKLFDLKHEEKEFLKTASEKLYLTGRSYDRILKVSRTIADLDDAEAIEIKHLAEAIQYRPFNVKSQVY